MKVFALVLISLGAVLGACNFKDTPVTTAQGDQANVGYPFLGKYPLCIQLQKTNDQCQNDEVNVILPTREPCADNDKLVRCPRYKDLTCFISTKYYEVQPDGNLTCRLTDDILDDQEWPEKSILDKVPKGYKKCEPSNKCRSKIWDGQCFSANPVSGFYSHTTNNIEHDVGICRSMVNDLWDACENEPILQVVKKDATCTTYGELFAGVQGSNSDAYITNRYYESGVDAKQREMYTWALNRCLYPRICDFSAGPPLGISMYVIDDKDLSGPQKRMLCYSAAGLSTPAVALIAVLLSVLMMLF